MIVISFRIGDDNIALNEKVIFVALIAGRSDIVNSFGGA